jgi:hypothetical protein
MQSARVHSRTKWRRARTSTLADVNHDGELDGMTGSVNTTPVALLLNTTSCRYRFSDSSPAARSILARSFL